MKTISDDINKRHNYNFDLKQEYFSSNEDLLHIPKIPIVDSGRGLNPKFNIRIIITEQTVFEREIVNLEKIKGTVNNSESIDQNFNPKRHFINKRFRKVWRWILLHPNNNENIIFPTDIILAKITNEEYYVVEGLRRVVALKKSDIKTISALILDYRDVYNKILEYRRNINMKKKNKKEFTPLFSSSTKLVKPGLKPTPVLKLTKNKQ